MFAKRYLTFCAFTGYARRVMLLCDKQGSGFCGNDNSNQTRRRGRAVALASFFIKIY